MKKTQGNPNNFLAFKANTFKKLFVISLVIFSVSATFKIINQKEMKKSSLKKFENQISQKNKKVSEEPASKKILSLEEISKSTALIMSGSGKNIETGSGFFIEKSLLVTNSHVIENAVMVDGFKMALIETQQELKDVGLVLVEDKKNDLAIIKTIKKIHKPLILGEYNEVKMGDEVFVLGSPQGLAGTLSKGIVSAKIKNDKFQLLQITGPISQGSSGSPVLSKDLKVIGVVIGLLIKGQNINFAITINYLKKLIKDNKENLVAINKLDLEKMLKENKQAAPFENKNFKDLKTDFERGVYYYARKNYKQALYWYKKAAEQGHAKAQHNIGGMYYTGRGVFQNYKQAFYYYKKAAEQENAKAQNSIGMMYAEGQGVPQNYKQALYWYKKSAEQGYAYAQFNVGGMYAEGQGVPPNYKQAFYWIKKAAEQGDVYAQYNIGRMYDSGKGVPQNYKQALYWLFNLLSRPILVPQNYKQAFYWYKKAAEQGLAQAQDNIGNMYEKGQGVSQNYKQAFYWYKKAAEQGLATAQYSVGLMYNKGQGVPQTYKQAFYWFKKAAEQGNASAQTEVGLMYFLGRGVPRNFIQAYVWFNLSSSDGGAIIGSLILKNMSPDQIVVAQQLSMQKAKEIAQRRPSSQ